MKKRYLKKELSQIRTSLLSTSTFAASGPLCMYIYIYNNIFISLDQYFFFFFFSSHVRELINIYLFFIIRVSRAEEIVAVSGVRSKSCIPPILMRGSVIYDID